jgi:hypothetical protein
MQCLLQTSQMSQVRVQPTPVVLSLTQRLGTVLTQRRLHVQVKALDFGHELVQFAPQQETFQPHYFVASTVRSVWANKRR